MALAMLTAFCAHIWLTSGQWLIPLSGTDQHAFLDAHNKARQAEGATAMQRLTWNHDLQLFAERVATRCNRVHSTNGERSRLAGYENVGENLYWYIGGTWRPTPQDAVDWWMAEKPGYDLPSATCVTQPCGHYTQIVWETTKQIGCAQAQCPNMVYVVCEYGPTGNWGIYKNGRIITPAPYSSGIPGSECASKYPGHKTDADGLCVPA